MTLTELLLALVITSVLGITVLRAMMALSGSAAAMETQQDHSVELIGLYKLFAMDLLHADKYKPAENGFTLRTNSCLDEKTMRFRHLPSVVTYEVKKLGSRNCLIRTQRQGGKVLTNLVCIDVSNVRFGIKKMAPGVPENWLPVPPSREVRVRLENFGRTEAFGYRLK